MLSCMCPYALNHRSLRVSNFVLMIFVMCPHDTGHVSLRFMACVLMLIKRIHTLRGYVPTLVDMCPHVATACPYVANHVSSRYQACVLMITNINSYCIKRCFLKLGILKWDFTKTSYTRECSPKCTRGLISWSHFISWCVSSFSCVLGACDVFDSSFEQQPVCRRILPRHCPTLYPGLVLWALCVGSCKMLSSMDAV